MQGGGATSFWPRYVRPAFSPDSRQGSAPNRQPRPRRRRLSAAPLSQEALRELDRDLARLARSGGALRLRVGEALARLEERAWHHELGFSSLSGYVVERCSWRARAGVNARLLALRLAELPVLRACLVSSALGWSMVELLARHATPETEEALAAEAAGSTVRAMRARLSEGTTPTPTDDRASITITMSPTDAWLVEHGATTSTRTATAWTASRPNRDPRAVRGKKRSKLPRVAMRTRG